MSGTNGRGCGRDARRRAGPVRVGMCLALVMMIALAGWPSGMSPVGVMAGPNDPPDATVSPNDPGAPNDPNDPNAPGNPNDPNDPGNPEPTPTFQSDEPVESPTPDIPVGQEPPPPDNPLPGPPATESTDVEVAPDVRVPDLTIPTDPSMPIVTTATLRLAGRICPRNGFDPYLNAMGIDWRRTCVETAPFSFGVSVMRSAPDSSYSVPQKVPAGGVSELTIPAPSALEIQHLAPGFASPVVACTSTSAGTWVQGAFPRVTIKASPGDVIECTWFAVRQDVDVSIENYVHVCGPDVTATTPQATLEAVCTGALDSGVRIDLTNGDGSITRSWEMEGAMGSPVEDTYWSRSASVFLDLPPGAYTLAMTVPAGYSHAFVSRCGPKSGYGGTFESLPPVSGSPSTYTVPANTAGKTYQCDWYLVAAI